MTSSPLAPPPAGSYIWAVLAVAVVTQAAGSVFGPRRIHPVPFWGDASSVSLASASLAVTVINGAQIATMFALGRAIDWHGERAVVGLAMLGMALAIAGAAVLADGLPALLLCMAFLGGTYAAVQPGGTPVIMRWFPARHRGLATGFRQATVPSGTTIAAALLPFLVARHGWHASVWAGAGFSLLGAVLFLGLYREGGEVAAKAETPLPLPALIQAVGRDPVFWPMLRLGIAMSAFRFTLTAHVIGFMADALGLGLVLAASFFAGAPGAVFRHRLAARRRGGCGPCRAANWCSAAAGHRYPRGGGAVRDRLVPALPAAGRGERADGTLPPPWPSRPRSAWW
ncbi:MFS transporter [Roseomonas sp. GCM10028921]